MAAGCAWKIPGPMLSIKMPYHSFLRFLQNIYNFETTYV